MYKDTAVCANGAMYRKDKSGFLPELMEKIYKDRTVYKKKMLEAKQQYEKTPTKALEKEIARCNNIQMARKIQLNLLMVRLVINTFVIINLQMRKRSLYLDRYPSGGLKIKMNQKINQILKTEDVDYVIASDTDSIYLNLGDLVDAVYEGREKTNESIVRSLIRSVRWNLKSILRVLTKRCNM